MLSFGAESSVFQFAIQKLKIKILKKLPVVFYGFETWPLRLREKRRLSMFENRVLSIFEPKREDVTWEWRKLHIEELNESYS